MESSDGSKGRRGGAAHKYYFRTQPDALETTPPHHRDQNTLRDLTELSVEDGGFPPCDPVMPPSLSSVLQEHQRELRQHGAASQPLQRHLRPQGGTQEEARAALLAARRRGPGAGGPEQRAGRALAQGAVRLL